METIPTFPHTDQHLLIPMFLLGLIHRVGDGHGTGVAQMIIHLTRLLTMRWLWQSPQSWHGRVTIQLIQARIQLIHDLLEQSV